jgi:ABC-type phosphate/phosphonate transport system substrate-binding protein
MLACLLTILFVSAARPAESGKADFVFAYTNRIFADVDPKDAMAAMNIYVAELVKNAGYSGESQLYDTLDEIVEKIKKGTVDFVVLSSLDYLNIKNRVDVVLSLGQAKGGKGSVKYLLLTNANRRYTKLGELKDKKLLITMKDEIAAMYLNTLLLKERFGEAKKFFSAVEEKTKPSQAVLSVFFGQADACVTTDVALKTMVELNPQLGKTLNIMASSPELVTTVTVFRRSTNINVQQNTREIGLKLKDNPRGRQVLLLFKIDGLVPVQESDLVGIRELMGEYDRLRAGKR